MTGAGVTGAGVTGAADHFDVIVVGAGSSGGVLASRLSEDPRCRVLLIEAGRDFPDERTRPPAFVAGGGLAAENSVGSGPPLPEFDWGFTSEPLADGRRVPLARGKLVGGTSMTNGCVFVRGRPEDFARWEQAGATGWGWDQFLPYIERVEREIPVRRYERERWLPFQELFVEATQSLGFRYVEEMNAADAWDGAVGPWPRNRRNEIRLGTLVTYIRAARSRPNFTIRDRTLVHRVVVRNGAVCGVECIDAEPNRSAEPNTSMPGATRETSIIGAPLVVLCAGAYASAPILLRSGIGPADELRALGITPLVDLPVGRHLMEHPGLAFPLSLDRPYARLGWPNLAVVGRGIGWWGIPAPTDEEEGRAHISFFLALVDGPGGSISLRSSDPLEAPRIVHRFDDPVENGGFDRVCADFTALLDTDAFRRAHVVDCDAGTPMIERLRRGVRSGTHPAGGCDIGTVVDPDLRVFGVEGLRVADASVFPKHVTNNPNLTCYAIGEYAAAKIVSNLPTA